MKHLRLPLLLALTLASVITAAQGSRFSVITGATLIDGTMRPASPDAVIVIEGARIAQAGSRSAVAVPSVMLDADPRADIRNVTRINRTFRGGVSYDPIDPARPLR